ncbi:MAG: hypothetical protein ABIZ04_19355 [Opitutus sp.]
MNALRPPTKFGVVIGGMILALAMAWIAAYFRQLATSGPDAVASSGMYAFGDPVLGIAVFGVLALIPIALALYWLRPVTWFWALLLWTALPFALTGLIALADLWIGAPKHWTFFLSQARIGIMPMTLLALVTCALFAPCLRDRWLLLGAALSEGAVFAGVILVQFVLPTLRT